MELIVVQISLCSSLHKGRDKNNLKKNTGAYAPVVILASVFFSLLRFFSFAYATQKKRNEGIKK